jgi:hypothetical protein
MGSFPRRGLAVLLLGALAGFAPHRGPRVPADTLTAMPASGVTTPLRVAPHVSFGKSTPSWKRFQSVAGGSWQAAWDDATSVPRRIWGSGIAAPGANGDPAIAERVARQVLAAHLALLAPGSAASDFVLVSNHSDGDIRSVGFVQRFGGRRVIGGQISFEFKRDRLFVIGSLALPNVAVTVPRARLAGPALASRATAAARAAVQLPSAPVVAKGDPVILPLLADQTIIGYRLVAPFEIDGGGAGRYAAYADVSTGGIVAVQQLNEYASGTVLFHGVDRWPGRGYIDRPAERAFVTVDGAAQTTTQTGGVTWSPDMTVSVVVSAVGDLVTVMNHNMAKTPDATATLSLDPNGQSVWDASSSEKDDADLQAFINTNLAKDYVRANLDAAMPTLDEQMMIYVNEDNTCNAFFDGQSLHFFASGLDDSGVCPMGTTCCSNTARLQDVNFHEFGHGVHNSEIIPGVGNFDGAMSEGAADFLAASITNDSGMGRGFDFTDAPLREIDPPDKEYMWPGDVSTDIHATGLIYSGALWDLRKAFIQQYGYTQGVALTNQIFVGTLRRSVDIPSSLIEALAADDDDGNLANGTPHECAIRAAYSTHGMRTATGTIEAPGVLEQPTASIGVTITLTGLSTCGTDQPQLAILSWFQFFSGMAASGHTTATPNGTARYTAQLPLSPESATSYNAQVGFADGTALRLPDNLSGNDPGYQLWNGPTVKLYCTDFENGDPFAHGWTTGTANNQQSTWQLTVPGGGASNPHEPFSGTHIFAQAPGGNYEPHQYSWVKTPVIHVGQYSDVHLQYRRWLAVQDSVHDQAQITANDNKAWQNYTNTHLGDASAFTQLDKEWRFHDVSLSGYFAAHDLQVGWTLNSDGSLEYSGWSIDDVCIVANPTQICGDGKVGPHEQCDNGPENADVPDKCRTYCRLPACGDDILDKNEECDRGSANADKANACRTNCHLPVCGDGIVDTGEECDGPGSDSKHPVSCTDTCELDGGCCRTSRGGGAGAALLAGLVWLIQCGRARRRRARR